MLHLLDYVLALSHCLLTPPSPRNLLQVVSVVAVVLVQQHCRLKIVRWPVRSSPVSAIVLSPQRSRLYTCSRLCPRPRFFLLLLRTLCSCTPPRTLNPCTLLPPCIDAKPSPTSPAHMYRMSSMYRRCHIVTRVVLCSAAAWAESCRGHLIHHFRIVHLVCRLACSRPPRVSLRTSHPSTRAPSRSPHRYPSYSLPSNTAFSSVVPPP